MKLRLVLTPEQRAAKYHASPLGLGLHYAWRLDGGQRAGRACDCGIGREHAAGAPAPTKN